MPYYFPDGEPGPREWVTTTELAGHTAIGMSTPYGPRHLHLLAHKGTLVWVVSSRRSALYRTPRCRLVNVGMG